MKKQFLILCLLFMSTASFCQFSKMKLKKKEVVSPMLSDILKAQNCGNMALFKCKDCGQITIRPNITRTYTKFYDSASREVARVDSSGKLTVIDSLATIKMLMKQLGVTVKD